MTTPPLFLVPALPQQDSYLLDGPEGRHAARVRRLRPGEELVLSDGRGGVARSVVEHVDRDALQLRLLARDTVPPPTPRLTLAQALIKGDRGELAVELATEAGIDEVVPWRAERCVVRWEPGPREDKAVTRWRVTAREAAKQARRAWVPDVNPPVSTRELAARAAEAGLTLVLHESATDDMADLAAELRTATDLLLVVGPEGGITDAELAELAAAGARPVRLGQEVLRASTAAAVALGALGVLTSRWARARRGGVSG